jgi:hypothetical protein
MSLADIVSGIGDHVLAQAALLLAAAGFLTVVVTTCLRRNQAAFERARFLPFEDGAARRPGHTGGPAPSEGSRDE